MSKAYYCIFQSAKQDSLLFFLHPQIINFFYYIRPKTNALVIFCWTFTHLV